MGTDRKSAKPEGTQPPDPIQPADEGKGPDEQPKEELATRQSPDESTPESVARAWAMLRQAAELGERAAIELTHGRQDIELQQSAQLAQHRTILSDLRADVVQVQEQVDRLARRVADAIAAVESVIGSDTVQEDVQPSTPSLRAISASQIDDRAGATPPSADKATGVAPANGAPHGAQTATRSGAGKFRPRPGPVTLVIHGVQGATTAMSLQRYLTELGKVQTVEPEHFAAGELRLRVTTTGSIDLEDLRGWPDGNGLILVAANADLIELRLPPSQ